ncbi:cilia- and flagella-associated protein 57 [Onthophagus taurus]|uniref:cilia- and flagella-associated protein 57 n=1 Tax=Onthophagus taurus TaxID=166361 RepID=UPI0039BE8AFA
MAALTAALPALQPRLILGINTAVKGNAHFINDEDIAYPCGSMLVMHNFNQHRQKFIKLTDRGQYVTSIAITPNRKLLAVAESGDRPYATLFETNTCKKKKQILIPMDRECTTREFACMSFTQDNRNLIVVTGEPDWQMYVYKAEKGRVESSCRANNLNNVGDIVQICCNPNDPNLLILLGNQTYRMLASFENVWRQFGFAKAEGVNFTSGSWLSQDRFLAGTSDGRIMTIESGELKAIHIAYDTPLFNYKFEDDAEAGDLTNLLDNSLMAIAGEDNQVKSMFVFSKGFAYACGVGMVYLYEKETPHRYRRRNVFKVPDRNVVREDDDPTVDGALNHINHLGVNLSEDRLLATCKENQMYTVRLWGPDIVAQPEIMFQEQGMNLHHGGIGSIAVCKWKPIFMTSGTWDRTIRIWNFESETLELVKTYLEEIHGLALHPTGLYAVVGFSDKLRFLTILLDDLEMTREFSVRNCKLVSFSNLGHIFAAANGNIIQVYSSVSFEHMFNLKGHNGRVTGFSWVHDDYKLCSCGAEGAVYEWQISTTRRISETIVKSCQFADANTTGDGKSVFAVGSDGRIREIMNCNIQRDVSVTQTALTKVVLSNSNLMLFVAGINGVVYSVKIPIMDTAECIEFVVHPTAISHMEITYDDRFIITASREGIICIWRLLNIEGKAIKLDKEFSPSTEILIPKVDLEEKLNFIRDLQLRMHELETEHAYQMRQIETLHNAAIKNVHEGYCNAIEELKEKIEALEGDHFTEINTINEEIMKMKHNHEEYIQKLENSYNEKLINEYEKYLKLEQKMEQMRVRFLLEIEELIVSKKESEANITNSFVEKLNEKEVQLEELQEEGRQRSKEHEIIKQQIEDDADREIYDLKINYETQLTAEQDANIRLKGEAQTVKKKLTAASKEIDDLKHAVHTQQNEQLKLKQIILNLEKDMLDLKKEIAERDSTIQDKEKRIFELKRRNQELEKFKFILDFKINELKSQIEPRERRIREQMEQITEMVNELENLQKIILSLDVQLRELREKLKAADLEIKREITKNRCAKAALKKIRNDIHHASGLIQDVPKLQKAVKEMYHTYNTDKDFEIMLAEDRDAKNEFLRQRDFLEKTIKSLQTQINKTSSSIMDKLKLVEENSALIVETNALRKDLKLEYRKNQKMEAVLGLHKKCVSVRETEKTLNDAVATRHEIHNEYKKIIVDNERCIKALEEENNRLLHEISLADRCQEEEIREEPLEIKESKTTDVIEMN